MVALSVGIHSYGSVQFSFYGGDVTFAENIEGKSLQTANEIHSIIWSISYTLGMALSGLVVYWVGVTTAFLLDAGLFVIVLTLISKIKIEVELSQNGSKLSAMMREAFTYIRANPIVYHLMILCYFRFHRL